LSDLTEKLVMSSNLLLVVVVLATARVDLFHRGVELGDLNMTFLVVVFSSSLFTSMT
jgi:hypothetical protein